LISEIFQRCAEYLNSKGNSGPFVIYDPLCGAGYSLAVLGLLHGSSIKSIFASDVDSILLEFANKNLSLVNASGLDKRIEELKVFVEKYTKQSHKDALESAYRLRAKIASHSSIDERAFHADILDETLLPSFLLGVDIVITDLPYGKLTSWGGMGDDATATRTLLDKLHDRLHGPAIAAISSHKQQRLEYDADTYHEIMAFTLEKRNIVLLEPTGPPPTPTPPPH
jgi:tRNA G10  N-methylase Trm11